MNDKDSSFDGDDAKESPTDTTSDDTRPNDYTYGICSDESAPMKRATTPDDDCDDESNSDTDVTTLREAYYRIDELIFANPKAYYVMGIASGAFALGNAAMMSPEAFGLVFASFMSAFYFVFGYSSEGSKTVRQIDEEMADWDSAGAHGGDDE